MRLKTLLIFLLISLSAIAQKEDHIWLFGAGFQINKDSIADPLKPFGPFDFDFNTEPMTIRPNRDRLFYMSDDNHSYSDKDGKLLLYTNGMQMYSGDNDIIEDTLNYSNSWDFNRLIVNDTTAFVLGAPTSQFSLLLPIPEKENEFMIFCYSLDIKDFSVKQLRINKLIKNENNKYQFEYKDSLILSGFKLSGGGLTACRHANGRDWWIITGSESFYSIRSYLLTKDNFTLKKINVTNTEMRHEDGQVKFSSDGSKIMISSGSGNNFGMNRIFDFNRETGIINNGKSDVTSHLNFARGAEISPSGQYAYATNGDTLWQYDLHSNDILKSRKTVATWDSFVYKIWPNHFCLMQLAPDGKIYISSAGSSRYFGVIEYPDEEGEACQVKQHSIFTRVYWRTMPTFPHYRLGPLDGSASDTLGIDNHPIAKFRYEQDTTNHLNVRFTDLSYYRPETWHWDFGDGTTFEGRKPYWHEFPKNGVYNVCLTVSNENSENTICRLVIIGSASTNNNEQITNNYISVFPNPTEGEVLLTISDYIPEHGVVYVYDMMGREVYKQRVYYGWNNLNLNALDAGTYNYIVKDKTQKIFSGKLIKI